MIPASYLYKDAYRQHWGEDFVRAAGEELEPQAEAGKRARPRILAALAVLRSRHAPVTRGAPRPDARGCPPVAA